MFFLRVYIAQKLSYKEKTLLDNGITIPSGLEGFINTKTIMAHATYRISSGKVERTNNLIKTMKRRAYGYCDDDYFFLKIMDESKREYVRNPKTHKSCD